MRIERRRVITGHDRLGRSCVHLDAQVDDIISNRPSSSSTVVWATDDVPADSMALVEDGSASFGKIQPDGTIFRIVRYAAGGEPRMHRTTSVDYGVVLTGTIILILDAEEVTLSAGDVLVQRGTMHGWRNPGPEPCEIAFVLVGARPVELAGDELGNIGW